MAVGLHLALFLIPSDYTNIFLYVRNQFLAWSFLFSMVQILDFLKFHHMFGPWAIIISSLLVDLGKFMTVLFLFLIGFSMLVTAMNTPFYQLTEVKISLCPEWQSGVFTFRRRWEDRRWSVLSTVPPTPLLPRLQVTGLLIFNYFFKKIVPNIYIIIQMLARSPGKSGKGGGGGLPSVAHDIEFGGLSL